jgi:uncharacterized membrane protein (DUF4010 family)
MAISACGYIAQRLLPSRLGLPLAGLASGFVSSTATIAAMGQRAAREERLCRPAVAGAVLSSVATIVQMAIVLFATSRPVFDAMRYPLLLAGAAAVAYGLVFAFRLARASAGDAAPKGRAFDLKISLLFAVTVSAILFLGAAVQRWLGPSGLVVAVGLAGFADAHAAAISAASLVAAGKIAATDAVVPILVAMSTNTVGKAVAAVTAGGRRFAAQTIPGLLLIILAAWAGFLMLR